jgi:transposase
MTERELSRAAARRMAIIRHAEEVTGNVALTCRYYGISRTLFYTWRRRYEELGIDGLRPRSRRPHTSPNATSGEVIGKIVHLRKTYHFTRMRRGQPFVTFGVDVGLSLRWVSVPRSRAGTARLKEGQWLG